VGAFSHIAAHLRGVADRCWRRPAATAALDGHHSAVFTLDNYGHLIDAGLGPSLDLSDRLAGLAPVALQPVV
jgi:hypothetical protein